MVVNGRAWPEQQVSPNRYRLRLLDACDSRTLILSLWAVPYGDEINSFQDVWDKGTEIPIWVIGTEQGLLPGGPTEIFSGGPNNNGRITKYNCGVADVPDTTSTIKGLLMQPGERYDVIVDFEGLERKQVYLINEGPDEPFKDLELVNTEPDSPSFQTTGQVMRFNVSLPFDEDDISTNVADLCFDSTPSGLVPSLADEIVDPENRRQVFLKEEVTAADVGVTLADTPFAAVLDNVCDVNENPDCAEEGKTWSMPITENIPVNRVEEWEVVNLSADSHPVHLHQIKFQVMKRCETDAATCIDGDGVYGYETGNKDAVVAFPNVDVNGIPNTDAEGNTIGRSTFIRMKFDILGIYGKMMSKVYYIESSFAPLTFYHISHLLYSSVWHCHILSHEDNEMMHPLCVYDPDDLDTLNNCCPIDYHYDATLWGATKELVCIESSKCEGMNKKKCRKVERKSGDCEWDGGLGKCVVGTGDVSQAVSLPFVAEDPEKMDDSSSYNAGLNIFAVLTAGLLFLQQ